MEALVLSNGDDQEGTPGHEVGFGAVLSLRQQFAAQLGVTPAHYRRSFREAGGRR